MYSLLSVLEIDDGDLGEVPAGQRALARVVVPEFEVGQRAQRGRNAHQEVTNAASLKHLEDIDTNFTERLSTGDKELLVPLR